MLSNRGMIHAKHTTVKSNISEGDASIDVEDIVKSPARLRACRSQPLLNNTPPISTNAQVIVGFFFIVFTFLMPFSEKVGVFFLKSSNKIGKSIFLYNFLSLRTICCTIINQAYCILSLIFQSLYPSWSLDNFLIRLANTKIFMLLHNIGKIAFDIPNIKRGIFLFLCRF